MVIAFDRKAPTFRHLEYTEYKAGRKKMPPELAMQIPLLKEVLNAMRIKILEIDGFEADEIIGTVAKKEEAIGLDNLIISGDKDELQLATEKTQVLITKKGISEFEIYDKAAMIEKYGFTPEQFIDFKGLMGDPSDNIPGIPGVGEKTAQKLIIEFGSVSELLANTDKINSNSLKEKIEENAQLAIMSRRLATINTEVPIEINFNEFKMEEPDYHELIELYTKLEFNSFLKKLQIPNNYKTLSKELTTNQASATKDRKDIEKLDKILIKDLDGLMNLKKDLKEDKSIVLKVFSDDNHKEIPIVYGISILSTKAYYFIQIDNKMMMESLKEILIGNEIKIKGHNLKADYYALLANGFSNDVELSNDHIFDTEFDTCLAQYLIEPSRSNYDLNTIMLEYFHQEISTDSETINSDEQLNFLSGLSTNYFEYGAKWCGAVYDLTGVLSNKLIAENLDSVLFDVELPLIEVLASMEYYGFAVDQKELIDAGKTISEKINELIVKIYALAGEEFNINSPKQLGVILFEKLGLQGGKKTKQGYATGIEILEKLRDDYEIVNLILEYRMLSKLKSTYIEGLLPLIHTDHKIHAHFQQTVAATGRISCTEPNLQNIPIRQELGRQLRKAFIPDNDNFILVGADYSQIELRVLAHMSQDPTLIEAFNQGQDIHRITASKVLGIPEDLITTLQRSNAKAVNFGVIYGMSGFGLSTELNITRKEAERYIDEYFKKYDKVKTFMDEQVAGCKKNGYVTTILNRKRPVNEINASNYMVRQAGERLAMNSPIQGSAADIIKLAMVKVYNELRKNGARSKLILQVHDELIIQTHKEELDMVKKLLEDCMENALKLSVVLSVDLNTGNNWYELK